MRGDVVANVVRLMTVGLLLLVQALWMYSLAVMKMTSDRHRDDCPFSRPYRFAQDTVIPSPEQCPYCVWGRIFSFNRAVALFGGVLIILALLSLVAMLGAN